MQDPRTPAGPRDDEAPPDDERRPDEAEIDEESKESFPGSDAPSHGGPGI